VKCESRCPPGFAAVRLVGDLISLHACATAPPRCAESATWYDRASPRRSAVREKRSARGRFVRGRDARGCDARCGLSLSWPGCGDRRGRGRSARLCSGDFSERLIGKRLSGSVGASLPLTGRDTGVDGRNESAKILWAEPLLGVGKMQGGRHAIMPAQVMHAPGCFRGVGRCGP